MPTERGLRLITISFPFLERVLRADLPPHSTSAPRDIRVEGVFQSLAGQPEAHVRASSVAWEPGAEAHKVEHVSLEFGDLGLDLANELALAEDQVRKGEGLYATNRALLTALLHRARVLLTAGE